MKNEHVQMIADRPPPERSKIAPARLIVKCLPDSYLPAFSTSVVLINSSDKKLPTLS